MLSRQIIINKLFNETVDNGIQITVGELKTLYDANKAQFQTGEKVTVRHILIAVGSSRDDATANKTAHEVLAAYKAGADFCTLVLNYTNDAGSKQTCGEYTFGRGFMVKPFEDAAFALSAGESAIVKTDFGYHVMLKMNDTPSRQIPFEEAAPLLEQQLQQQRRLEAYQAYISALRENATIVNNLVSASEAPTTEANATLEPLQSSTPAVENATGANTTEASTSTTVTIVLKNETNTTVTMLPAPSSPPATEQAPLPSTGQPDLSTFAQCLSEKGTTLYVASWDTISRQTLASFGDAAAKLSVVDCASAENADACSAVQAYPTWKVNGKLFLGPLSFNELASRTGCVSH